MKQESNKFRPIICSPYEEPRQHWRFETGSGFVLKKGRRPAGYAISNRNARNLWDVDEYVEIALINRIRDRVAHWRRRSYPGVTGTTRRLLEHWLATEIRKDTRLFYCQLEAIETLIWLVEAHPTERAGIEIPTDGGGFPRYCTKMATGTGKTIVMSMVIAWNILNKVTAPNDPRFSKNVFVVTPGLTIKNRLQVLKPTHESNYYINFEIVPRSLLASLRRGRVVVKNRHVLEWEKSAGRIARGVDKRGPLSDEAYIRSVLGEMANAESILVINDEAHHAWRKAESKVSRANEKTATQWISGLDRIDRVRGIMRCHDFSATPFPPVDETNVGEFLFGWVVSDFGLNDAIESGITKTPRIVVRDDAYPSAKTFASKFYHIFVEPEVCDDLNQRSAPDTPLPNLLGIAYHILGFDWLKTNELWAKNGSRTPPVMITVANRTETAARIKYAFDKANILIDELCRPDLTLHIDSKVLEKAEASANSIKAKHEADEDNDAGDQESQPTLEEPTSEHLRRTVDTVGKIGEPGEQIRHVISVGMLTEGWDTKSVTHIMGLRAFSSPLLCEQVIGRGLRRTSYETKRQPDPFSGEMGEFFEPEYVNVFGVPFTYNISDAHEDSDVTPDINKTAIHPVDHKARFEILWPNVIRVDRFIHPTLTLDLDKISPLVLDKSKTPQVAQVAPVVDDNPFNWQHGTMDAEKKIMEVRGQSLEFWLAQMIFSQIRREWSGETLLLIPQLIRLVGRFVGSDKIKILPRLFQNDEKTRHLLVFLNSTQVVEHLIKSIRHKAHQKIVPVFDSDLPILSTCDMPVWYTGRPCCPAMKCHINHCVCDSSWEGIVAKELDSNMSVSAWVKNDHLGFEIYYVHKGGTRKYLPDFVVSLSGGDMLILEVKGKEDEKSDAKHEALSEWVAAVNSHGELGYWKWAVLRDPSDLPDILNRACSERGPEITT